MLTVSHDIFSSSLTGRWRTSSLGAGASSCGSTSTSPWSSTPSPPGSPSSWLSLLQPRELTSCWPRNQARATDWLTRRKMENDYSLTEQNIEIGATAAAIAPAAAAARSLDWADLLLLWAAAFRWRLLSFSSNCQLVPWRMVQWHTNIPAWFHQFYYIIIHISLSFSLLSVCLSSLSMIRHYRRWHSHLCPENQTKPPITQTLTGRWGHHSISMSARFKLNQPVHQSIHQQRKRNSNTIKTIKLKETETKYPTRRLLIHPDLSASGISGRIRNWNTNGVAFYLSVFLSVYQQRVCVCLSSTSLN